MAGSIVTSRLRFETDGVDGDADEEQEAAEVQPRQDRRTVSDRISSPSRH